MNSPMKQQIHELCKSSPIGLYFASLWYDEKLYPITSYLEAVSRMMEEKAYPRNHSHPIK
jgi:hypothetical protein